MSHLPPAKHNSLFSNALSIFLTRFFPSLASTLVVIYFSWYLDKPTYGAYQNFWIQLNVLYPVACFGVHAVVVTYAPSVLVKLKDWLSMRAYLLYGLWVMILSGLFALLQHESLHLHFAISYLFMFAFGLSFVFESILFVFKSFKTLVVVNFLYAVAFSYLHWKMLHSGWDFQRLFFYLLLICWARFLVYAVRTYYDFKKQAASEDSISMKEIRKLWLHMTVYDIVQTQSNWIDKFLVSLLLASGISAVYFNGTQNIPFLPILLSAAGSAVLLQLGSVKEDEYTRHAIAAANYSGKLLSSVMFPVFFFFLCFRYEVFDVLFKGRYMESVPVFMVSLLLIPVRSYSFTSILQNRHRGGIINTGAIAELLLACLLMYPLYQLLGLPGLALSFVISTYLQAAFYLFQTGKILEVPVFSLIPVKNWLLKFIIFALVFIGIHYLAISFFSHLISLILGIVVCAACIGICLLYELKRSKSHVQA